MNELMKQEDGSLMAGGRPQGMEDVDQNDLIIPRAKLLQPLSPELQEPNCDLRPGFIINSITKEILPEEFIPVFMGYQWLKFNPRDDNSPDFNPAYNPGQLIYRTNDPNDELVQREGKFGPNGEPPAILKFMNFLSYFPGEPMPIIVSFTKTSYKAGKRLASLVMFTSEGGRMYTRKYKLTSKQEKNDKGVYYVLNVEPSGKPEEEAVKAAAGFYSFRQKDIVVHEEEDLNNE